MLSVDAKTGWLPVGTHTATLEEIYDAFVDQAPFQKERDLIFRALSVYLDILRMRFTDPRVLLNGGFTTHKSWAAPKDVDLAIGLNNAEFKSAYHPDNHSLVTLADGAVNQPQKGMQLVKLQPMGGLVDGYLFPARLANMARYWEDHWSKVKDEHGNEIVGARKGFVEVTF
jgi:hypothetical protein